MKYPTWKEQIVVFEEELRAFILKHWTKDTLLDIYIPQDNWPLSSLEDIIAYKKEITTISTLTNDEMNKLIALKSYFTDQSGVGGGIYPVTSWDFAWFAASELLDAVLARNPL